MNYWGNVHEATRRPGPRAPGVLDQYIVTERNRRRHLSDGTHTITRETDFRLSVSIQLAFITHFTPCRRRGQKSFQQINFVFQSLENEARGDFFSLLEESEGRENASDKTTGAVAHPYIYSYFMTVRAAGLELDNPLFFLMFC